MPAFAPRFAALALAAASLTAIAHAEPSTPVARHGALATRGHQVIDAHGQPVALSGVSFFWSNTGFGQERMFDGRAVDYFVKDWHASVVRAAIGADARGGYIDAPDVNLARLDAVVQAAVKDGVYVIIDWHSHHADAHPQAAAAFFTLVAHKYGHLPNIIYELFNEPLSDANWATQVKPYAEKTIDVIRAIDPDHLIIVGTPTWSQDVDIAAANPITGRKNIAYTLHFYAGTHKGELRAKAEAAMHAGAPLFVTEWGTVNADGDGPVATAEVNTWFQFVRAHCLSTANWAVSDKKEGASIFKNGVSFDRPITDNDLTPSGLLVRDLVRQAPETCKEG